MEDFEEFDAAALLASINSNLEEALNSNDKEIKSEDNFENSPIKKEKKKGFSPGKHEKNPELIKDEENKETLKPQEIQKSNIFTIVRDSPEVIEEIDPLLQTLQRIKITNSLLTNEECTSFSIDTHKIQNLYELILKNYDKKLAKATDNQRKIFEMINKVKFQSQILQTTLGTKDMPYLKMKNSEKENKYKQIKILDQDAEKSKFYLLSIIHRMESLECNLDKLIDYNIKNKKKT